MTGTEPKLVWQSLQHKAPEVHWINGFVDYIRGMWMNGHYRFSQLNNHLRGGVAGPAGPAKAGPLSAGRWSRSQIAETV